MFASPFRRPVLSGIFRLLLVLLALGAGGQAFAATYYVRTDGGSAAQCTGLADAAYSGSGSAQACAWKSPHSALPASGAARIAGGDTLIIGAGEYMIGWGATDAAGGRCYSGGPYDCYLAPVPSGPSASAKTRILGRGHDTGCAAPPKLWGTERVGIMFNLSGSSNVEVACLEITDKSDCVEFHSNSGASCQRNTAPYGNWASTGISASASSNVALRDVNIHGLANTGMHVGGISNWNLDRVKINANGWVGWNGDLGAASSNSGQINLRHVEIAWNGCGERWQTGTPWACFAQEGSGYGDGLGTGRTGGQWLIEDSFIHHNTSDGLDLLYMDSAASSSITVRRVYAVGNAGNQVKTLGNVLIENSVIVGNCAYFNGRDYMLPGDQCRASGNSLSVGLVAGQTANIRYNTITGEGDCLILTLDGTSTSRLNIQNNALIGQPDFLAVRGGYPEQTCAHYAHASSAITTYTNNLVWNTKGCPTGSNCTQNPQVANIGMASFDGTPLAGSPLIDRATAIAGVIDDFLLQPRPAGAAYDIGAYEVQSGTPPPVCTRAAPTLGVTGPTTAVAAGTTNSYTVSLRNNDSASCGTTSFSLARTVPSGWTGTLAGSLSLAPGASTTTALQVTSAASATAGSYGVGVGTSSSVGASHSANASINYVVAAPQPVCTRAAPTLGLTGPTAAVAAGTTSSYTLSVRNNDSAACATTSFTLARTVPSGWTGTLSGSTLSLAAGASGTSTLQVTSPTGATAGSYGIGTGASSSVGAIHSGNASTTYVVAAPVPVCTRAAPTLGLTGPTAAVAAGTTSSYTLSVRNNDSAACASTSFNLARTVPGGWTGTLSGSSISLAAGASGTRTLQVTSTGSAAAGSYGIGTGASSSAGSIHAANASATYVVAPPAAATLTATLTTYKGSFRRKEMVYMSMRVFTNGQPTAGLPVKLTVTYPNGTVFTRNVTSNSDGYGKSTFSVPAHATLGTYQVRGVATSGSNSVTANTSFVVLR